MPLHYLRKARRLLHDRSVAPRRSLLTDPQWKSSFEDVYAHPALMTKWHVIVGNHDYKRNGRVQAQIDYAATPSRFHDRAAGA